MKALEGEFALQFIDGFLEFKRYNAIGKTMRYSSLSRKAVGLFRTTALLFIFGTAGSSQFLHAQSTSPIVQSSPRTLQYQGVITKEDAPLGDGDHKLTVTLYADDAGKTSIWSDDFSPRTTKGVLNVSLGSGKPLPEPKEMDRPLWVGVKVDGEAEMHPLIPLSSSAFSLNIADGAVTAKKMGTDYVSAVTLNGKKITSKGSTLNLVTGDGIDANFDDGAGALVLRGTSNKSGSNKQSNTLANHAMLGSFSAYGSGDNNEIGNSDTACMGNYNFIGAGDGNILQAQKSFIGSGEINHIFGCGFLNDFVGGGRSNEIIHAGTASILGGHNNTIENTGTQSVPEIGLVNSTLIGGGEGNLISAWYTTNRFDPFAAHVTTNGLDATFAAIVGGSYNESHAKWSFIGGGWGNKALGGATAQFEVIGGGSGNTVNAPFASILGGGGNTIEMSLGGILPESGVISGGRNNKINGLGGTIAGGFNNQIKSGAIWNAVGGGYSNTIQDDGTKSAIPGGDNLVADSYAQLVAGCMNAKGAPGITRTQETEKFGGHWKENVGGFTASQPVGWGNAPAFPNDGWQVIIGNGCRHNPFVFPAGQPNDGLPMNSNSFVVTYSGHSLVFDVNGSGGATPQASRPPRQVFKVRKVMPGATYMDNTLIAWGNIPAVGGSNSDFGVLSAVKLAGTSPAGTYLVTLNTSATYFSASSHAASITATLVANDQTAANQCVTISTSELGAGIRPDNGAQVLPNQFIVWIRQIGGDCSTGVDKPFMFKVTGCPIEGMFSPITYGDD